MSLLSLPFAQLGRLHLQIRLLQTSAGLSFTLETVASSNSNELSKAESCPSQTINFRTGHDERGPVLEIFASKEEEARDIPRLSPPTSPSANMECSVDEKPARSSNSPTPSFDTVPAGSLTEGFDGMLADLDQGLLSSLAQDSSQGFGSFWNEQITDPSLLDSLDFLLPPPQKSNGAFDFGDSLFSDDAWMSNPMSATASASGSSAASTSSSRLSTPELISDSASPADQQPRKRGDRSDRRRLPCPVPNCGRRFTSQYTLKVHVKAHRPKPKPCFPCTQGCNEQFSRQHDRLRHEVAKHRMVCEWSCPECHRFFSSSKTLGNHKCKAAKNLPGAKWQKPL